LPPAKVRHTSQVATREILTLSSSSIHLHAVNFETRYCGQSTCIFLSSHETSVTSVHLKDKQQRTFKALVLADLVLSLSGGVYLSLAGTQSGYS
jgi:hypothetical protein